MIASLNSSQMDLIVDFPQASSQATPSVSFTDDVEIKRVENLTCKYREDLWFMSREMKNFKYSTVLVLRKLGSMNISMVQYAEMNIQDTSTFMGLESYMSENTTREIKYQRQNVRNAVLSEQRRQERQGVRDPEAMASISETATEWARSRARVIGLLHDSQRSCSVM